MARSRSRKTTKRKTAESNVVLGPHPFKDAARKGLAWSLTGIANANHYQAKSLANYAKRCRSELSANEYERLTRCASAIEKVHLILYDLAAEMDEEIARRWKQDPQVPRRTNGGPKEPEPPAASASGKRASSRRSSSKRAVRKGSNS